MITKSSYYAHTELLFAKLRILKVSDIKRLQIVTFIFKSRTDDCATELFSIYEQFDFNIVDKHYGARSVGRLYVPSYRTDIRKFCLKCPIIKLNVL